MSNILHFHNNLTSGVELDYFSAVALGTRTLARCIFSTPSYSEKTEASCVLELITIVRLT